MYYSLRGTLIAADGRSAAVECGGVGYLCTVSAQTYSQLPEPGEEVLLYTHLSVREDAMELYGFSTQVERSQAVTPRVTIRVRPLSSSGTSTMPPPPPNNPFTNPAAPPAMRYIGFFSMLRYRPLVCR